MKVGSFDLHSDAHHFDIPSGLIHGPRKVFSVISQGCGPKGVDTFISLELKQLIDAHHFDIPNFHYMHLLLLYQWILFSYAYRLVPAPLLFWHYMRPIYQGIDYPTDGCFIITQLQTHLSGAGRLSLIVRMSKNPVLNHRHLIIGHLIYLSIALGLHSFSLYIHFITYNPLGVHKICFQIILFN
jgi:hypothetical protein